MCGTGAVAWHMFRFVNVSRRRRHGDGNYFYFLRCAADVLGIDTGASPLVEGDGALGEMDWLDCDCLLFRPGNILHDRGMHVEVIRGR